MTYLDAATYYTVFHADVVEHHYGVRASTMAFV